MSAYLRPRFTMQLAQRISRGQSLNLISPHGQGRRRTLHDLQHALAENTIVIRIDLERYASDYPAFIACLSDSVHGLHPDNHALDGLLRHIEHQQRCTVIILHNMHAIHENNQAHSSFDQLFFDHIHRIQACRHLKLLCVSESIHDKHRLKLRNILLPAVTATQLQAEIQRRALLSYGPDIARLSAYLLQHEAPYSDMDSLTRVWLKHHGSDNPP